MAITITLMPDLHVPDKAGRMQPQGDRLALRCPFQMKDAIAALPGSRWAPAPLKFWHVPASVDSAATLAALLTKTRTAASMDQPTLRLLARAEEATSAQAHKHDNTLPEIPGKYCACPEGPVRVDENGEDTQGLCDRCGEVIESWMHQRQAFWWAVPREGAGGLMDMGTGKSKVFVSLADHWEASMVVIVAPSNAVRIWPRQFRDNSLRDWVVCNNGGRKRDGGLREHPSMVQRIAEADRQLTIAQRTGRPFALIVNYEAAWREPVAGWLLARKWDLAGADESHTIKSAGGKTSKFMERLSHKCERRLLMTGTFMPHDQLDAYAQMRFQDPGVFGTSFNKFKARYFRWGGFEGRQMQGFASPEMEAEFLMKLNQATIVIDESVLDLPPVKDMDPDVFVLEAKSRQHYREMVEDWQTQVSDVPEDDPLISNNVLSQMTRLAQITSGHLPYEPDDGDREIVTIGDEKARMLEERLDSIPVSEPVVVFARFKHDLERIREIAEKQGRRYAEISGRSKSALDEDGRMRADCDLAGVQLKSGGVGIDLTRARYCIYYSLDFNLGGFDQSRSRVHRPGQKRSTFYYYLVAAGTIDVVILDALRRRADVTSRVMQAIKTGELDNDD